MKELFDILGDITIYLSVIYPLFYILGFSKNNKTYKIFTLYLIAIALVQISLRLHKYVYPNEPNLYLFVYYFVSQFIFLSLFYYELLQHKWILFIGGLTLLFIGVQYIITPDMYFRYNPIGATITQVLLVFYSLLYFYRSLSEKKEFIIVNVGVFFYLLSSILIFASGNLVLDDTIPIYIPSLLQDINISLYLIFQLLIMLEWWKNYADRTIIKFKK
ncbi:hypothetical protein [Altibacter sp.]|uniref:hypothetical protein n=1 Tax=Altibacter sp. TaxID=2024823 RepID=UPI000C8E04F0|nr:hypothetical protein [Altibacter sp.]MAP54619.1 hypothetical protein [Altibacter sp.]